MLLFGFLKPVIPVNGFIQTIYTDKSGNYYIHKLSPFDDVVEFIQITINDTSNIIQIEDTVYVDKNETGWHCYISSQGTIRHGTKLSLNKFLLSVLYNDVATISTFAKMSIAAFYKLYGKLNALILSISDSHIQPFISNYIEEQHYCNSFNSMVKTFTDNFYYLFDDKSIMIWYDIAFINKKTIQIGSSYIEISDAFKGCLNNNNLKVILLVIIFENMVNCGISEDDFKTLIDDHLFIINEEFLGDFITEHQKYEAWANNYCMYLEYE